MMWDTVIWLCPVVLCAIAVITFVFGHVYRLRAGKTTTTASLSGQTIIITGASAGIGKEAALDLAQRKARIILACRNVKKATDVAEWIKSSTGNKEVVVQELDTSSLESVRAFAARILVEEYRLDVLVLNAGIYGKKTRTLTSDGFELTMATNHFGHFLLANLLLGLLKESSPSRVVVTSSMAHSMVKKLDCQDLSFEKSEYWAMQAYSQSKLCNILFARHLAHLLKDTGVVVNSFCPGLVATEIFKKAEGFMIGGVYRHLVPLVGKSCDQGAQTIIHLAAAETMGNITGEFFEDCHVSDNATNEAIDDGLAKKLWEASEALVGLKPEERHY